jgi:hypothetical protein
LEQTDYCPNHTPKKCIYDDCEVMVVDGLTCHNCSKKRICVVFGCGDDFIPVRDEEKCHRHHKPPAPPGGPVCD